MGSLLDDLRADAAEYIAAEKERKRKARADRPRSNSVGDAIPLDLFQKMLDATPYMGGPSGLDDRHEYGGWLAFAMDCHEASGGDEADYLEAFIQWCHNDPHGKETWTRERIEGHWQSFSTDPAATPRTRASWFKLLLHLGHKEFLAAADWADHVEDEVDLARTVAEWDKRDAAERGVLIDGVWSRRIYAKKWS